MRSSRERGRCGGRRAGWRADWRPGVRVGQAFSARGAAEEDEPAHRVARDGGEAVICLRRADRGCCDIVHLKTPPAKMWCRFLPASNGRFRGEF